MADIDEFTIDGVRAIRLEVATSEYRVSRATLYRLLREGKLTRYEREGDRHTWLDRDELDRVFTFRERRPKEDDPA